ncbi:MAG: arginyl-tRNA synthetase [Solirubrobacterales bacterium]|nr:arginyl-tRNA synthetase [Solirubrobacterales bacterium]
MACEDDVVPDAFATLTARLAAMFDAVAPGSDPVVRPSDRSDLQANGALALAKALGRPPREVAEAVVAQDDLADICSHVEVAGPGFINLTLSDDFLAGQVAAMAASDRLGVPHAENPERAVVDYSAPNVAKEMHVGHLRSTVIGDAIVRLLSFAGHDVIRENHVGDWGTPFGMLIEHLVDLGGTGGVAELDAADLTAFYRDARAVFDASEEFQDRSRERVVLLQAGDPETLRLWRILVDKSAREFQEVYDRLGVLLTPADIVGESFYNPLLRGIVDDLDALGLLEESEGARVVFQPGFAGRDGEPMPVNVQKADGGYNYTTTDLATVRDRTGRLGATWLVYVVGAPQAQHFAMAWKVCELAGWLKPPARCEHVQFGNVLGDDRKMLRTRAGGTLRLADLLDEAVTRARAVVESRSASLDEGEREAIAHAVGIGAVKFADLSSDRVGDYVFSWDRMLALDGFTAPYLQYAHARILSIFRRAGEYDATVTPTLGAPAERALALALAGFAPAVHETVERLAPHRLCGYLFELAQAFTAFYDACPVLRSDVDAETRASRLALCGVTARTLATGLDLLGIEAPQRM